MDSPSKSDFLQSLYDVDPVDFEHLVAAVWRAQGWKTHVTQASQDSGIDVVCEREMPFTQKQLIQVKRYGPETTVSSSEIQQYASLRQQEENVDSVIVITSSSFSRQARSTAQKLNVKLIGGDELYGLIQDQELFDAVAEYLPSHTRQDLDQDTSSRKQATESRSQLSPTVSVRWQFESSKTRNPPTANAGAVYTTGSNHLYRLDTVNGAKEWELTLPKEIRSRPVENDRTVFVGNADYYLYAVDRSTGREQWEFETDSVVDSVVADDGTVYLKTILGGTLYAVDATDGTEEWSLYVGSESHRELAIDTDTVYLDTKGSLFAVDRETGSLRWKTRLSGGGTSTTRPVVGDGLMYVENADTGNLTALDTENGSERWTFETRDNIWTPAVADGTVFVADNEQAMYAIDAKSGQQKWRVWLDESGSEPVVVDDTALLGSWEGYVYALDASDGREKWSHQTGNSRTFVPSVCDDSIIVGTDDGVVYSLSTHW